MNSQKEIKTTLDFERSLRLNKKNRPLFFTKYEIRKDSNKYLFF